MSNNGNKFTYKKVSPGLVQIRNDKIEKIKLYNSLCQHEGYTKKKNNPSYSEVCIDYVPLKNMLLPEDTLVAKTHLYAIPGALECGYSQCINWTAESVLNAQIRRSIGRYTIARLKLASACIGISNSRSFKVKNFYQCVESSEKSTISFIIGGFFCYQSATFWLNSRHEKVKHFIHAGLAEKASLSFTRKKDMKTTPDYLIETTQGKWHTFESKGGESSSRWQRIEEGIAQLESVTEVGWKGKQRIPVSTFVCTHASMDTGKEISIHVVDPDPVYPQSIILNHAVCVLLTKIALINLFDTLVEDNPAGIFKVAGMEEWIFISTHHFDGIQLGIPEKYLNLNKISVSNVGVYLALKEIIDSALIENNEFPATEEIEKELSHFFKRTNSSRKFMSFLTPLLKKKLPYEETLHLFSEYLGLSGMAYDFCQEDERLEKALSESVRKHRSPWGGLVRKAPLSGYDDPWEKKQKQNKMKP